MTGPLLLAVDVGGSTLRASLVDAGGAVVHRVEEGVPHHADVPPVGRRWDPPLLWRAAARCIAAAAAAAPGGPPAVAAVAATGQRLGCAFADGSGEAVYAGPNLDARGVMEGWRLEEAAEGRLRERTGRGPAMLYAPARLLWLREQEPSAFARVRWALGPGDWVALRLCGEAAVDPCAATELLAWDLRAGARWTGLWESVGLDPETVPRVLPAGSLLGEVTHGAAAETGLRAGIPVAVTTPDTPSALLGAGAAAGQSLVLAGSTMPVLAPSPAAPRAGDGAAWVGPHPVVGALYEGNGGTAGFAWEWTAQQLVGALSGLRGHAAFRRAEELAAAAPPGAHGVLAFPAGVTVMLEATLPSYLSRAGAGFWPAPVVEPGVAAPDLVRATLEGVCHAARANLDVAEAARGAASETVVLAGGMAGNAVFRSALAGVLGRPVHLPRSADATATGAAACAAVAAGWHRSLADAVSAMTSTVPAEEPDPASKRLYAEAHRLWLTRYAKIHSL